MDVDRRNALLALGHAMERFPYLRITQLISKATGLDDSFYVQDARLAELLEAYAHRQVVALTDLGVADRVPSGATIVRGFPPERP